MLPAALFLGAFLLLAGTDSLYGITYDEPIYQAASMRALEWLALLAREPMAAISPEGVERYWRLNHEHPGFYKLVAALSRAALGGLVDPGSALRVGTNLLVALCITALYLLVAAVWGRAAGLYAAGALLLMPRVFAHAHLIALDAPVMALSFLTVAAAWRTCLAPAGRSAWAWSAVSGVLWGLTLGTKMNAFFVPLVLIPWVLLYHRRRAGQLLLAHAVLGPLAFVATWPWLWYQTGPRFAEFFLFHFRHFEVGVQYFGKVYSRAPWHFAPVMTAITTPPATLLLAAVGVVLLVRNARRGMGSSASLPTQTLALAAWAILVNLLPSCLPDSPKYNGVRLFLSIFPMVAILAAAGFHAVLDGILRRARARDAAPDLAPKVAAMALFLALLGPLMAVAQYTPYHLSYYNALIGGLPGATRSGMEPTYWGDSYRAASLWLAEKAEQGATIWVEPPGFESSVRLFELGPMRPDLRFVAGPDAFAGADYAVTQNKPTEFTDITRRLVAEAEPVFTDGIAGVPLIYVFRVGNGAPR